MNIKEKNSSVTQISNLIKKFEEKIHQLGENVYQTDHRLKKLEEEVKEMKLKNNNIIK